MSAEFKAGDMVKVVKCENCQPKEMLGRVYPIKDTYGGIALIDHSSNGVGFGWSFVFSELEHAGNNFKPSPTQLQGKFTMEDGTPGVVDVTIRGNTTQVTIIVDPQEQYHAKDRNRQFFGGLAHCNPCDKFDINTGIKEACKNALHVKSRWEWRKEQEDYFRSIYSAIRKAMRGEPK